MDGPYKVQNQSIKWTDPTRVKLTQVHKVNGPRVANFMKVYDVDGPNKVNINATSNRTDPTLQSSTK